MLDKKEEEARKFAAIITREERKRERKPINQETFLELLEAHQEWLKTGNGEQADFSFCDLSGLNLSHLNLSRVNFYGAFFKRLEIEQADFTKADLRATEWQEAKVKHCNFNDTMAMEMILDEGEFTDVTFKNARLMGATFTRAVLSGDFTEAVYDDDAFSLAYLEGVMG